MNEQGLRLLLVHLPATIPLWLALHHGSKISSSLRFVRHVAARLVWEQIQKVNTALNGAI